VNDLLMLVNEKHCSSCPDIVAWCANFLRLWKVISNNVQLHVQKCSKRVADHLSKCSKPAYWFIKTIRSGYARSVLWHRKWNNCTVSEVRNPTVSVLSCTGYPKAPGIFRMSDCPGWANLSASKISWQCPLFFSLWGSGKDKLCRTPIQEFRISFAGITHSMNV
jgi:hypothetical protein